jgi:endonuclease YncB( thermonuclease family)
MGNCCKKGYNEDRILSQDMSELPMFGFNGLKVKAKVLEVYDGDTITIVFIHSGILIKYRMRMEGYDSPELKPNLKCDNRDLHIKCGNLAKSKLEDLILDRLVYIKFSNKNDKYGRLLGIVYFNTININQVMINEGYGKSYNGGKKEEFSYTELNEMITHL